MIIEHSPISPIWNNEPVMIVEQANYKDLGKIAYYYHSTNPLFFFPLSPCCVAIFRVKKKITNMDIANEVINKSFAA